MHLVMQRFQSHSTRLRKSSTSLVLTVKKNRCMSMLYWSEDANKESCNICHTSRWKPKGESNERDACSSGKKRKKIATKVLHYFPLQPCLQRLFMSFKIVEQIRWHVVNSDFNGLIRHPKDFKAWKMFNSTHLKFPSNP